MPYGGNFSAVGGFSFFGDNDLMCVTVWVLRYKKQKNGDQGTIVFTATLNLHLTMLRYERALYGCDHCCCCMYRYHREYTTPTKLSLTCATALLRVGHGLTMSEGRILE